MKLLLRKNVEKLGKIGDVVKVANGYGRNFLLPMGLAVHVTPAGIQQIEIERKREASIKKEEHANILKLSEALKDFSCTIFAKANEDGRLFGSVTAQQIADALNNEGYKIEESMVKLEEPIKQCDIYNIAISLAPDVKTTIKLWVVRENEEDKNTKDASKINNQSHII